MTEAKHVRSVSLLSHGMTVLSPRTECETMQLAGEDGLMSVTGRWYALYFLYPSREAVINKQIKLASDGVTLSGNVGLTMWTGKLCIFLPVNFLFLISPLLFLVRLDIDLFCPHLSVCAKITTTVMKSTFVCLNSHGATQDISLA